MLQGEHSAILSTCIKLPFVMKICVLSIFEWPLKTGFTVFKPGNHPSKNQFSLCIHWVTKISLLPYAHSKDSDQTGQLRACVILLVLS